MRRDAESAEPMNVFEHVSRLSGQRIRRGGKTERDEVSPARADLHRIDAQHAGTIGRRIGDSGRVAVIGEDDELQSGACRDGGDVVGRTAAVRAIAVDVQHAADGVRQPALKKG